MIWSKYEQCENKKFSNQHFIWNNTIGSKSMEESLTTYLRQIAGANIAFIFTANQIFIRRQKYQWVAIELSE